LHDDKAALVDAVGGEARELSLSYRFRWRAPGDTRFHLPYQRRGWYAHGLGLTSALTVDLIRGGIDLTLQLPFESFADTGFVAWHEALAAHLGPVLDGDHFNVHAPAPYADVMLATSRRYDRHA
jgi:hypothetical protein